MERCSSDAGAEGFISVDFVSVDLISEMGGSIGFTFDDFRVSVSDCLDSVSIFVGRGSDVFPFFIGSTAVVDAFTSVDGLLSFTA